VCLTLDGQAFCSLQRSLRCTAKRVNAAKWSIQGEKSVACAPIISKTKKFEDVANTRNFTGTRVF
jgi:hypothetical protein